VFIAIVATAIYSEREPTLDSAPLPLPNCEFKNGAAVVRQPGDELVGEIGVFHDELFAYLMFDHYRSSAAIRPAETLLTYREESGRPTYRVLLHLSDNLLEAVPFLAALQREGVIPSFDWGWIAESELRKWRQQTTFFASAYNLPVRQALDGMPRSRLAEYMRRFLRFKSVTDPRIRRGMQPLPEPLSSEQAGRLAADIIAVSDFYSVPLDLLLGIGAMENNYMNVKGDIGHAVWKRRAQPGDIVVRRRRGRVLVLNESTGVWQITRETLRYAHALYLKDTRDYSKLPERLRPPRKLDLDHIEPEILTTYAGILVRDLLDHFNGDVAKAVGAYNGGVKNPNAAYEEGVTRVAQYARRMLERAAALNGESVIRYSFIAP
jgi:hypothetical protein